MIEYFKSNGYTTGVIFEEKYINHKYGEHKFTCPSHNPALLKYWIYNENAFAIKWKYVLPYLLFQNIKNPFFNYQLKYLYFYCA